MNLVQKKKVAYIVSDIDKALAFEWIATELSNRCNLFFILITKPGSELENYIKRLGLKCYVIDDARYAGYLRKLLRLIVVLFDEKPRIVHAHLWRATLLGMLSAWLLGIEKRVFTRHHGTIHYELYPAGRKWDVLSNFLATDIVAISNNTKNILIERDGARPSKIRIIHHGFLLNFFADVQQSRTAGLKKKYSIHDEYFPIVGVISRYTYWKGIQYIIPAFVKLKKKFPTALLLLAGAEGEYKEVVERMLNELRADDYREILFENDIAALYGVMDLFVHVPIDPYAEAFGQTYVEALAAGVPSVFSLSGIAPEFIESGKNALVVDFKSAVQIEKSMEQILDNENLKKDLVLNGKETVRRFSLDKMVERLEELYG